MAAANGKFYIACEENDDDDEEEEEDEYVNSDSHDATNDLEKTVIIRMMRII